MTTQNRQPVLRCVLSNAAHPEYGQVTIPFPIPVMKYEAPWIFWPLWNWEPA